MNTPTVLTPNPAGLITVAAGYTPTANIHEPDSTYAQFYILPVIGPLSYLAWSRLNMWLPADDNAAIGIGHDELAWSLGAAPARLDRSINRLVNSTWRTSSPVIPTPCTSSAAPRRSAPHSSPASR